MACLTVKALHSPSNSGALSGGLVEVMTVIVPDPSAGSSAQPGLKDMLLHRQPTHGKLDLWEVGKEDQ